MKKDKQNCEIGYYSPCPKHEDSVPNQEGKIKMYSEENPLFEKEYKGFKVKAWYQRDNENAKVKLWLNGNFFKEFEYQAYAIWNIFLHFEDMVNREIKENLKDSTPEPQKETPPESRGDWRKRFREKFVRTSYPFLGGQHDNFKEIDVPTEIFEMELIERIEDFIQSELTLAHTEGIEEGRASNGYVVVEIHEESGATTDGQKLYWAKVRKANLQTKDN